MASAYRYRPPYPEMVFDVLTGLITDAPSTVLDLGAGGAGRIWLQPDEEAARPR